ncbi:WD40-repeat-containing domain protein [Hypomontagnella monticulosa]|nr:WD40-repeat-containing domain protein [Hypomontagnella monticulosa]
MKPLNKWLKSLKHEREKSRNGDSGVVASPASLGAISTDSTEASPSNPTEPYVSPNLSVTTAPAAPARDEPPQLATASVTQAISNASSGYTTEAIPEAEECQPAMKPIEEETPTHSTSQRLWNAAYDSLESDKDTTELVRSYVKVLTKALKAERASDASAPEDDVSAELKDPTTRQTYMRKLVKEGRERFAATSKITEGLGDVIKYIENVKGMIDAAIKDIPQAALPWAGVCLGLQILSNPGKATKSNLKGIVHVISRMDWYCAMTEHLLDKDKIIGSFELVLEELEKAIVTLYKALLLYQIKSACYYRNRSLAVLRGFANLDDWDGDLQGVKDAEAAVENMSAQYHREYRKSLLCQLLNSGGAREKNLGEIHRDLRDVITQQEKIWMDDKEKKCLQDLFVVNPRNNMRTILENKDTLLEDAYKWIFHTDEYAAFTNWTDDESGFPTCRLLWIKGHAGMGKTMLLIGIISELERQLSLLTPKLSYFFCQGTNMNLNNATATLRSLIWLLLFQQPYLIEHIQADYEHQGRALFENQDAFHALEATFESMLKDPRLSPVYFIVDALDECDQGLAPLLSLISKSLTLTDKVKWLVSSRPELNTQADVNIRSELDKFEDPHISRSLVELDPQILKDPVNVYIDYKLSALKGERGYSDKVLAEVSDEVRQRSMNIFLWVALVFKELYKVEGWDAVTTIKDMPSDLLKLYDLMMARIERLKGQQYCKNVLVAAVLAYRPLSLPELAVVAGLPAGDNAPRTIVKKCGSFLLITGETVSLIHQSAKDYLNENYESRLHPGGVAQGHTDICKRSIDAMSILKENIYGRQDFAFNPDGMKPPSPDPLAHIRYSCLFWIDHLTFDSHDYDRVYSFLKVHFLHWLEALSLMGKSSQLSRMISQLEDLSSNPSELYSLVCDAKRFIPRYISIIESAPLQIYSSAILFSPQASIVRRLFQQNIDCIRALSGVEHIWSPTVRVLEGPFKGVESVMFSPDGKSLAICSYEMTVQVWDVTTGQVKYSLEGHSREVLTVVFSPDGNKLASGSWDKTIRIWDIATGQAEHILEGHSGRINTLAFTPDGKKLASGSGYPGRKVRVWDVASGHVEHILEGHSSWVGVVLFSPDGRRLVSGSCDKTIRVWDVLRGQNEHTLEGHSSYITRLVFSPDGTKLVSCAGEENTVRVWDAARWRIKHLLEGHSNRIHTTALSPDGSKLVSGSSDNPIRVWDVATGQTKHVLEGHSDSVLGVVFSPDGSRLASRSADSTVRLWNVATWKTEYTLEGHSGRVSSMAFSPDGESLASASTDDKTVRIWDIMISPAESTFESHSRRVSSVAFSPNGKLLASASRNDKTIRIWDTATGRTKHILGHPSQVTTMAFSPDGSKLASASGYPVFKIHIWDVTTGQTKHTFNGYSEWVKIVLFSPDGNRLAGSNEGTIRVWNVATGQAECLQDSASTSTVAFSPDGKKLASGNLGCEIRLWDTTTNQVKDILKGHTSFIKTLTFSIDGRKLASGSYDNTIRIWEVATGQVGHKLDLPDSSKVEIVLFSPDGKKIASGSEDSTIRVWDVATGRAELMFRGHSGSLTTAIFQLGRGESHPFYSVDETNHWVTRNGARLLYLPKDHQPGLVAVKGRILVTGSHNGRITIMEFAEGTKGLPRWYAH